MSTNTARDYYAGRFPDKIHVNRKPGEIWISSSPDPEDDGAVQATFPDDERGAFVVELCRRWNHSPEREQGLMDIRRMAANRKTCIRMPGGMMLENFCGQILRDPK